ncbi:MAG: malonyl-CoA decarboxylase [Bosea sp.]|uniref:malonyl-CoA decarboxylase n=1 Tax=unclassified Bosea (in: a-proteobacteria) TaxID=2653178 RepID=UPI0009635369|nr:MULTISPECIES: malonyl-CoA decarboxylase [unclassified Bosea (in: a-proteobacteria)]MBN9456751.1 malonyl-CoA decarboxylase [Bosea sp. (in: a-proteobacteria)]OJV08966.1 MAG: MCD, Malonyl-CoA decarboxylase MCD [Bosea sp. 67-29]
MAFLGELLINVADRGRALIGFERFLGKGARSIDRLCEDLLSGRGEASGMALAQAVLEAWQRLDKPGRLAFFNLLKERFGPDPEALDKAIERYREAPDAAAIAALHLASEPRRQELLRRLNLAPEGTHVLVQMREALFEAIEVEPDLKAVDTDFRHLFGSWFNRGFLVLRRIDWRTPANVLEKIIRYEAVHEIQGWDDLRRRLEPADRRCFAFFHPQLVDDPLIFVEVALTTAIPHSIGELLEPERDVIPAQQATTAVFYSISNCQEGLRGISFGNFLIKQVAEDLKRELPGLDTFVTLSPVPGFARWLAGIAAEPGDFRLSSEERSELARPAGETISLDELTKARRDKLLGQMAAQYLLRARTSSGRVIDPVARFHLGNGARLERINVGGNLSARGLRESHGVMVNYRYDLAEIETNHEAFATRDTVVASSSVRKLLRPANP